MIKAPVAVALLVAALAGHASATANRVDERLAMVETIEVLSQALGAGTGRNALDAGVLDALRRVPRHEFVPARLSDMAYRDRPLPIGHGQTISQPFMVALMTDLLELKPSHRVLEIGTGSGYQAAVLSLLAAEVYSIEIVDELASRAALTLSRLRYTNVVTRAGDGYLGWPDHAPFDAILVTAAPDHAPPALVEQLKPGGRMVIPIGARFQELMLIVKAADGATTTTSIIPVRFVPLTREQRRQ